MDRRSFLRRAEPTPLGNRDRSGAPAWRKGRGEDLPLPTSGDLTPYTPRPEKPWDTRRVAHFFRRATFGATRAEIDAALTSNPTALLDAMLAGDAQPSPPGGWTSQKPFVNPSNADVQTYYGWIRDMQEWWFRLMIDPARSLREKVVLFWHNHFVSEYPTVVVAQYMFKQNRLFRENGFGSFLELTKKVTVDPAMLVYLDGATSRAGNPNENYARELLELFTLGAGAYSNGTPHYTEADIVDLARALTGWTLNVQAENEAYAEFKPTRFDAQNKSIFGESRNWGIEGKTPDDVIDHIFAQVDPDHNRSRAAIYLCSKIYQYFVYNVPDMTIVEGMADTLVQNNWSVGAVVRQLLLSEHFFDDNVVGAKIKSPAEFVAHAIRAFALATPMDRTKTSPTYLESHDPITTCTTLSQTLLAPPGVQGWIGGRSWISGATMPLRIRYAKMWIEPFGIPLPYGFDPVAWAKSLPDHTNPGKLVDAMIDLLLAVPLSQETRDVVKNELTPGGFDYEWDVDAPNAAAKLRAALLRITALGEYELL